MFRVLHVQFFLDSCNLFSLSATVNERMHYILSEVN